MSDDEPTFGRDRPRPIVFERAPFSKQCLSKESLEKFDKLPSWQRCFIDKLIQSGDFEQAIKDARAPELLTKTFKRDSKDVTFIDAFQTVGINPLFLAEQLKECMNAQYWKSTKEGPVQIKDLRLKLEAVRAIYNIIKDSRPKEEEDAKDAQEEKDFMEMFGAHVKGTS